MDERRAHMSGWNFLYDPLFNSVFNILGKERQYNIHRAKVNLVEQKVSWDKTKVSAPHCDSVLPNAYTLLYYINDADGDTHFYKQHETEEPEPPKHPDSLRLEYQSKQSPKANYGVLFKSSKYHAGQPPIETEYRAVVNIIFTIDDSPNAKPLREMYGK
jgi:hypothetical protein